MQNFWMHDGSLTGHSGNGREREYREVIRVIFANLLSSAGRPAYLRLARRRVADVARHLYRTRGFKPLLSNWQLMVLILVMGIDFR
jgi:hypothetical protein